MSIFEKAIENITVMYLRRHLKESFRIGRINILMEKLKNCLEEKDTKKAIISYVRALVILEKCSWEFYSLSRIKSREKTIFYQKLGQLLTLHLDLKNNNRLMFIGQPIFWGGQNMEDGTHIYHMHVWKNSFNETEDYFKLSKLSTLNEPNKEVDKSWGFMKASIQRFYDKMIEVNSMLNNTEEIKIKGMEAYDPLPLR